MRKYKHVPGVSRYDTFHNDSRERAAIDEAIFQGFSRIIQDLFKVIIVKHSKFHHGFVVLQTILHCVNKPIN